MANEVKLPRLGQGMEAGTVNKWLKSEGDTVAKGEPLFEVDTDKVTQEVESDFAGVLLKIVLAVGRGARRPDDRLDRRGRRRGQGRGSAARRPKGSNRFAQTAEARLAELPCRHQRPSSNGGRIKASPLARRIARERGIDLRSLHGTGPDGPHRRRGRRARAGSARPLRRSPCRRGEIESIPLTNIRKTIARRLTAAWEAPVFQLTVSADMTRANELVAAARELNPDVRVTVTDVLAKVCAQALMRHRDVNVQYTEDALLKFPTANVGIAVAAPQGLVVPVVRSVERLTLAELAVARGEVVGRARESKLTTQDLEDGTFTISNLGMFGIEQFVAVLNPPQAAILAVGATIDTPVVRDGAVEVRPMLSMTLTVDHRAVDGAEGADFLRTVKQFVEEPALAL